MSHDSDRRAHKIRALLDKAEATSYPAEAEALTAKATSLMAEWQITEAMLDAGRSAPGPGGIITRDIELGKGPYVHARLALLASAGAFQQCRVLTGTGWNGRVGHLIGHAGDVARAEMLYTSLLVQATAAAAVTPRPEATRGLSTTSWRRNFLLGFARTAGERLQDATEAATTVATRGSDASGSVALVLAERISAVDDWVAAEHGRLGTMRAATVTSSAGWSQGRAAAERADLGVGDRLDRTARALTR